MILNLRSMKIDSSICMQIGWNFQYNWHKASILDPKLISSLLFFSHKMRIMLVLLSICVVVTYPFITTQHDTSYHNRLKSTNVISLQFALFISLYFLSFSLPFSVIPFYFISDSSEISVIIATGQRLDGRGFWVRILVREHIVNKLFLDWWK